MRRRLGTCLVATLALSSCKSVHEEPKWVGLTEAQIVAELGTPSSSAMVTLSRDSRLPEYQSGLYRHVPAAREQRVEVKELRWKRLTHTAAVWLMRSASDEWVVVETLVWSRTVTF